MEIEFKAVEEKLTDGSMVHNVILFDDDDEDFEPVTIINATTEVMADMSAAMLYLTLNRFLSCKTDQEVRDVASKIYLALE